MARFDALPAGSEKRKIETMTEEQWPELRTYLRRLDPQIYCLLGGRATVSRRAGELRVENLSLFARSMLQYPKQAGRLLEFARQLDGGIKRVNLNGNGASDAVH